MLSDIFSIGIDLGGSWIRLEAVDMAGRRIRFLKYPAPRVDELSAFLKKRLRVWKVHPRHLIVASRGIWTPAERSHLKKSLKSLATEVQVMSDVEAASYAAFGSTGVGVMVVAGTGSIALGRNARGRLARAGGWGPLLGDEGSSFWIGKKWLQRTRAYNASRTILMLARNPHGAVRRIAALTPGILFKAGRGDRIAREIIDQAQTHLAGLVDHAAKQLHLSSPLPVSWGGSLMNNPTFRKGVARALRRAGRKFHWIVPGSNAALAIARLF